MNSVLFILNLVIWIFNFEHRCVHVWNVNMEQTIDRFSILNKSILFIFLNSFYVRTNWELNHIILVFPYTNHLRSNNAIWTLIYASVQICPWYFLYADLDHWRKFHTPTSFVRSIHIKSQSMNQIDWFASSIWIHLSLRWINDLFKMEQQSSCFIMVGFKMDTY